MKANKEKISQMLKTIASYNDSPGNGVTRFSYGENDKKVRDYLIGICQDMGLKMRVDAVGNIFARLESDDNSLPVVMSGSHIDSVKNGGMFDGLVGVVGAIEAVRAIKENDVNIKNPIEVVMFAEEEGSNFQVPVLGSKVIVGKLTVDDLKEIKNANGESAYDVIKNAGFNPDDIPNDVIENGTIKTMIEMHIEQSVRLDTEGHTIGIVEGIAGLKWLKVTLTGCSNHAGATPMHLRNDPMVAASEVIAEINTFAKASSVSTVATVGNVEIFPNIANAIPAEVCFTIDIRDINQSGIDKVVDLVELAVKKSATKHDVDYEVETVATTTAIEIPGYIKATMASNADKLGVDYIRMPSGAVHDSNYMSEVTDVGMIFVPSINGRSHVKEENTTIDDIVAGTDLLIATLVDLSS